MSKSKRRRRDSSLGLTHLDEHGRARMVDVGSKAATPRLAVARASLRCSPATARALVGGALAGLAKGDALGTARVAGILAAKRTAELIPLCHALALSAVAVDFAVVDDGVAIEARASCLG